MSSQSIDQVGVLPRFSFDTLCHVLIWEAGPLRLLIEGGFVLLLYNQLVFLLHMFSPGFLQIPAVHVAILGCLVLVFLYLDTAVLCRGFKRYQAGFKEACKGDLFRALEALHLSQSSLFPPQKGLVLLQLSEYEQMLGHKERSKSSLEAANVMGVPSVLCDFHKVRGVLFSKSSEYTKEVGKVLENSEDPIVCLENAILALTRLNQVSEARAVFKSLLRREIVAHPSLASSYDLALVGKLCGDLHLGKAETALIELEFILPVVVSQSETNHALRPYAAFFLLERAKYFDRKGGRDKRKRVREDVLTALSLCNFPCHREIADTLTY